MNVDHPLELLTREGPEHLGQKDLRQVAILTLESQDVPALFNQKTSEVDYKQEKGWHRIAAALYASGSKVNEIAIACDVCTAAVTNLLKQRFFQENVARIAEGRLGNALEAMLDSAATDALMTMHSLLLECDSPAVRQKAAADILDRKLGKAPQTVTHNRAPSGDVEDEIKKLRAELEPKK